MASIALASTQSKNTRPIDNHLLIDPVQVLYPDRSDDHHELRCELHRMFFPWVSRLAQEGHVIFMTGCLAAVNPMDAAFFQEHLDLVCGTWVTLYWINAYCDQACLEDRAQSSERVYWNKTKLKDVTILRGLVEAHHLFQQEESNDESTKLVVGPLDTNREVDEFVTRLMEMVGLPWGAGVV